MGVLSPYSASPFSTPCGSGSQTLQEKGAFSWPGFVRTCLYSHTHTHKIINPLLLEMQLINEGSTKYDFKSV